VSTENSSISWRLHLSSPPEAVYRMLTTEEGRAGFWAEEAPLREDRIRFQFPNGGVWSARVLDEEPPKRFSLEYYGGTVTTFELNPDGQGGTDLMLTDEGIRSDHREDVLPGWVSVLLALKAAVDAGVDLRNHDPTRTWDQGYVDN
jgi:uncharacterized protein YndB with AHSA1/START domain